MPIYELQRRTLRVSAVVIWYAGIPDVQINSVPFGIGFSKPYLAVTYVAYIMLFWMLP
jgi:hypothetical protein